MELHFAAKHVTITDGVRDYAQEKIGKLERYLPEVSSGHVEFTLEKTRAVGDRIVVQVTLDCNGHVLRSQQRASRAHRGYLTLNVGEQTSQFPLRAPPMQRRR